MSTSSNPARYLSALLAGALAAALALLFLLIKDGELPVRMSGLVLQTIPSLIAALVAYVAIYFILEKQGIFLSASIEQRSRVIASELFKYQYGNPRQAPASGHDLSGRWKFQDWRHGHPEDKERARSEDAQIYQDGSAVWGTFSTLQGPIKDGTPTPSRYAFYSDLEGDILTGRWWQIGEKSPWKGAFQFKVIPGVFDREVMEGCWVGFSHDKVKINSGYWEWARPGQSFPSERSGQLAESAGSSTAAASSSEETSDA